MADQLRAHVTGLTERDGVAVGNYLRGLLETDVRPARAQKLTAAYADRLMDRRIDNLARTELAEALTRGQREAWRQGVDDGTIAETARRVWRTGANPCPICEPMNGQSVGLDEEFETGDGDAVDGPPAHPSCECSQELEA